MFLFIFAFNISAQQKEVELLDEFGWIPCEDLRSRLDNFMFELSNRPDTYGYIITYDGKYDGKLPIFGETNFRTNQIIQHFKFREFPLKQIMFINGGIREDYTRRLFIVPKGINPPKPEPTLDKIKYRKGKLEGIICNEG